MKLVLPLALIAAFAPLPAVAQALSCRPPQRIAPPRLERPSAQDPVRRLPIGGYTLAELGSRILRGSNRSRQRVPVPQRRTFRPYPPRPVA